MEELATLREHVERIPAAKMSERAKSRHLLRDTVSDPLLETTSMGYMDSL